MLKVWRWQTGRPLYDVAIGEAVQPFIAVRRARPKRGYDSDGERKQPSRRWLARQRRRQAKATVTTTPSVEETGAIPEADDAAEADVEVVVDNEDEDEDEDEKGESEDDSVDVGATSSTATGKPEAPAPVLVVQKIETSRIDKRLVVVFSAVGCVSDLLWSYNPALTERTFQHLSVLPHCSGLRCRRIPPPDRKRCLLYMCTTLVGPSSPLLQWLGALIVYGCPWTSIGTTRVRLLMLPRRRGCFG